jgi:hypothetical protein
MSCPSRPFSLPLSPVQNNTGVLHIGSPTLAFYSDERVLSCWDMFLHLDLEGSMRFFFFTCYYPLVFRVFLVTFSLCPPLYIPDLI